MKQKSVPWIGIGIALVCGLASLAAVVVVLAIIAAPPRADAELLHTAEQYAIRLTAYPLETVILDRRLERQGPHKVAVYGTLRQPGPGGPVKEGWFVGMIKRPGASDWELWTVQIGRERHFMDWADADRAIRQTEERAKTEERKAQFELDQPNVPLTPPSRQNVGQSVSRKSGGEVRIGEPGQDR
jgi:hypothetical protein